MNLKNLFLFLIQIFDKTSYLLSISDHKFVEFGYEDFDINNYKLKVWYVHQIIHHKIYNFMPTLDLSGLYTIKNEGFHDDF